MAVFSPTRRFERYSVDLSATCLSGQRLADRVVDLSSGGARVVTPLPLPAGTSHTFCITVHDARARNRVFEVAATVAWSLEDTMGLKFETPCDGVDDYLRRLERASRSI